MPPTRSSWADTLVLLLLFPGGLLAQLTPPHVVPAGSEIDLPSVVANDNRVAAGTLRDGVLELALEVVRADWRIEGPGGPGLKVAAVAEIGGPPQVPAPLVRVEAGTRVRVSVANRLEEPIHVFGLQTRPAAAADSFGVAPGGVETVEFEAGEPGTYLYRIREGAAPDPGGPPRAQERAQLAGALVVDPPGGSPADRVLVINVFSQRTGVLEDTATVVEGVEPALVETSYVEALTINGRSWPHTERLAFSVGDSVRWRVVNASGRVHPMHLHGFYYRVLARGTATADTLYAPRDRRLVVTETMRGGSTMLLDWSPTRPGRWLFHCHLSFHVSGEIRLPGAVEADAVHGATHMAGLVLGLEVAPGPTDLVSVGPPRAIDLYAGEWEDGEKASRYGFSLRPPEAGKRPPTPGPPLIFNVHQAVDATVHNLMSIPTGVHWHGLELDAWADGVPGWSRSDGKVSPVIEPGERFTYRLSLLRPGTFMYHSHLDDVHQLTGGLYGPLVVLPEGEAFDPSTDHLMVFGWNNSDAEGPEHLDLNGTQEQPPATARVGERHRFRLINIAPAGMISAGMTRGGEPVPITLHAKDGADLPPHQRVGVERLPRIGVGETADFTWTPEEPGTYELRIGYPRASMVQVWTVVAWEPPS